MADMTDKQPTGQSLATTDGALIQISRSITHPVSKVWEFLTESDQLGRWYGTFTGEPGSGEVELSFVESPDQVGKVRIDDCSSNERLAVTLLDAPGGEWTLAVALEANDEENTALTFTQTLADFSETGDIGPGWEYYLDRLEAVLSGEDAGTVDWEQFHPAMVQHYSVNPR